ncbi:TIGR03086 family metal-binding protein [Micromonosporaceae bacterium Da 78-11]
MREADAAAVRDSAAIVAQVTAADLGRPTPCAEWDLGALLEHMTTQHLGFAAAAEGRGTDPAVWQTSPGPAVVQRYAAAADEVLEAFAAADVLDRPFALPEFGAGCTFPGRLAIGFHLVDYVVHGWDVARALGLPYRPDADVLAVTLPIARAVPAGAARLRPGSPFGPALAVTSPEPLAGILALLGRDPAWRP